MFGKKENHTINSIIGIDTVLEGNLVTKETTRIDGCIKGDIKSEGIFIIGKNGKVEGNMIAVNVLIAGVVKGNITASGKVEIADSGSVNGDILAATLIIDENAKFQGKCNMKAVSDQTNLTDNADKVVIMKNSPLTPPQ